MNLVIVIIYSFSIYLLIAYSFRIIQSTSKCLFFTHGFFLTFSAYVVYNCSIICHLPFWVSVIFAILTSILLSLLIYSLVYSPLIHRKYENWQIMIASLGLYVVLQNVVSLIWGDSILSFRNWKVLDGHMFLGVYITDLQIITIIVCVLLLQLVWLFMEKAKTGKQIKAVSSNDVLSDILGLNTKCAIIWSFVLGTGLASCAGILIAADTDMTPTMGFNWLLYAVVSMIIGGMGKTRYLLLGALLLATAQHLTAYFLDSKWMNATAYIILIVFLYLRPTGFSGKQLKKSSI